MSIGYSGHLLDPFTEVLGNPLTEPVPIPDECKQSAGGKLNEEDPKGNRGKTVAALAPEHQVAEQRY